MIDIKKGSEIFKKELSSIGEINKVPTAELIEKIHANFEEFKKKGIDLDFPQMTDETSKNRITRHEKIVKGQIGRYLKRVNRKGMVISHFHPMGLSCKIVREIGVGDYNFEYILLFPLNGDRYCLF